MTGTPLPSGFIEAIRSSPADDLPRLAAADWLDENGDPARAELIRVQCDLARLDPADERYPELHVRQLDLLAAHEREWLGGWADWLVRWRFDRGFVRTVTATPKNYIAAAPLFAAEPVVAAAFVDEDGDSLAPDMIRDVLACRHSGQLRLIDAAACRPDERASGMFGGDIHTATWLRELARADHIRLESLSLYGGTRGGRDAIDPTVLEAFCEADHLSRLRHLDLTDAYGHLRREDWGRLTTVLVAARFAPALRSLGLNGCELPVAAVRELTTTAALSGLASLELDAAGWHGVAAVVGSDTLGALRAVTVQLPEDVTTDHPGWSRFDRLSVIGPGRLALLRSPAIRPTRLSVACHGDGSDEEAEAVAEADWFPGLTELHLTGGEPSDLAPLFDRPAPPGLRTLALNPNDDALARLAGWPGLAWLGELDLTDNYAGTSPAVELFRRLRPSRRLVRLGLTGVCGTDDAAAALAENPNVVGVTHLDFAHNALSAAGVRALAVGMPHLESLHLWSEWRESGLPDSMGEVMTDPAIFPRLRDVVVGSESDERTVSALRRRFGPRLRVFSDC